MPHLGRVFEKMVRLTRHGPDPTHLPHQPFRHPDLFTGCRPAKAPGLLREVLQDRAAFEDRDRRAVRPVRIDNGRHPVVGRDLKKIGLKLVA